MNLVQQLRKQKALSLGLLVLTLVIGILIGTVLDTGVKADRSEKGAADATPLSIPSPVELSSEFSMLAQKLEPAVVFIQSDYEPDPERRARAEPSDELELFRRFFGGSPLEQMPQRRRSATGSGFIVDPKGYIITNHHVVDRADNIKVRLVDNQTEHKAKLIGFDVETDLAVIKIETDEKLQPAEIGNSDAVKVGDWAVAIGSPFGLEASVTAGIVSAKGRDIAQAQQFQKFIQTDAAINPGNSGGPLLNIRGEVIGVNTMIATRSGGYQGIGFALPINMAVKVYNTVIKSGRMVRGSIGIGYDPTDSPTLLEAYNLDHGVVVSQVQENGPAERAGIRVEDVILEIDGKPVKDGEDLVARVADTPVGTEVQVTIDRNGDKMNLPVTILDRAKVWSDDPRFSFYREEDESSPAEGTEAKFGIFVKNLSQRVREELGLEDQDGVLVTSVDAGSFADEIGLRVRDLIVSINRRPVTSVKDIQKIQETLGSGDAVAFRVLRPGPGQRGEVRLQSRYLAGKLP
ncbi:MAG: Do family serine endopeptidase [bacterium]|nr:Do family serine endopeptidase [bacterium]